VLVIWVIVAGYATATEAAAFGVAGRRHRDHHGVSRDRHGAAARLRAGDAGGRGAVGDVVRLPLTFQTAADSFGLRRVFAAAARWLHSPRTDGTTRDERPKAAWTVVGGAAVRVGEDGTIEHVIVGGP
jgi:hypothetical protein